MRILYAVQATGNGHISRAADVVPELEKYGAVDVFLSGSNCHLSVDLPVKFRSKGLSLFYNQSGKLNYSRILQSLNPPRIIKDAWNLPVKNYDLVINDFDCITSLACKLHHKESIQFGHQASFISNRVPRPKTQSPLGEFILKNFSRSTQNFGLHFWPYDSNIFTPILRTEITQVTPKNFGHITVYLNHYSAKTIAANLSKFKDFSFQIFSQDVSSAWADGNLEFHPIDRNQFTQSLVQSHGLITGAGFETPAEAMLLNKKLMVIPIEAQYEQLCNAQALLEWNVSVISKLESLSQDYLDKWYNENQQGSFHLLYNTEQIISSVMQSALTAFAF